MYIELFDHIKLIDQGLDIEKLYIPNEIFFIQHKLQLSYTFSITYSTRDEYAIKSLLIQPQG